MQPARFVGVANKSLGTMGTVSICQLTHEIGEPRGRCQIVN